MSDNYQPVYRTWGRDKMFRSVVWIQNFKESNLPSDVENQPCTNKDNGTKSADPIFFSSEAWEKNKRYAEQAAAVVAIHCLGVKKV